MSPPKLILCALTAAVLAVTLGVGPASVARAYNGAGDERRKKRGEDHSLRGRRQYRPPRLDRLLHLAVTMS